MANRTFKELLTYHLETNPEFEPLKELQNRAFKLH